MKSVRGLARLNTRLHLMVSVTPVLYELFIWIRLLTKRFITYWVFSYLWLATNYPYLHQEQTGLRHIHQFQAVINKKESTEIADAS